MTTPAQTQGPALSEGLLQPGSLEGERTPASPRVQLGGVAVLILALLLAGSVLPITDVEILQSALGLALFACATNLLVGYGGLVSFGQGAFYGTGAYTVALLSIHLHASFWVGFVAAPFAGAFAALLVGVIALRTRELYFALLTLAFAQLFYTVALLQTKLTNGSTGIFGHLIPAFLTSPRHGFYFILVVAAISLGALWWITVSPFGQTLRAIRENRDRAEALGINVYRHQLLAFVISGFFCALAGTLFVVHDNAAYPGLLNWIYSGYPVFMAVIGGMFSFLGPALGALVYRGAYTIINQHTQDWQLVLGLVLLVIALFAPDGIVGLVTRKGLGKPAWKVLARWLRPPGRPRPGSEP